MEGNPLVTKVPNSTIGRNSSINFKVRDIVKYRDGSKSKYGRVKRCCLLNDIPCLGIEMINDISKAEYYLREEFAVSVSDIATETEYVENFMILPSSIITTEDESNENWKLNQSVKVRSSGENSYIYEGKIRWTGKINSFKAAAVTMNNCDEIFTKALNNGVILGRKLFDDETGKTGFFTLPSLRKVLRTTISLDLNQPHLSTSWITEWNERNSQKVKEESNFKTPAKIVNVNQETKVENKIEEMEKTINANEVNVLHMEQTANIVNDNKNQGESNSQITKKESPTKQRPPIMSRSKRYKTPFVPKVKEENEQEIKKQEQEEIQSPMNQTGDHCKNQAVKLEENLKNDTEYLADVIEEEKVKNLHSESKSRENVYMSLETGENHLQNLTGVSFEKMEITMEEPKKETLTEKETNRHSDPRSNDNIILETMDKNNTSATDVISDNVNETSKEEMIAVKENNQNKIEIVNGLQEDQLRKRTIFIDVIKPIILELMKLILIHKGDLTKAKTTSDLVVSLFSVIHDRKYFQSFLHYSNKLDLLSSELWRGLLMKMVIEQRHDIVSIILDKCCFNNDVIEFLLTLAVKALKLNDEKSYKIILGKCPNRNIIMENGETLLTHLMKTNEDSVIIKTIIESRYFDLDIINKNQETVLMVACQKFNLEVVKLLLQLGCDVTQAKMFMYAQTPTAENKNISTGIKYLLTNPPKLKIMDETPVFNSSVPQCEDWEEEKNIIIIIQMLWSTRADLVKTTENQESVLSLAYNLDDKRYFECLLENVQEPLRLFSNEAGMKLLMKMSSEQNWNYLSRLLDLSVIENTSNSDLLQLALEVLKKREIKTYEKIIDKCTDLNAMMACGETFLTNLFKHNIEEEIIKIVIKSKVFDIKKFNSKYETALMLACSRLMKNVVELILQEECHISHGGYAAVRLTVTARTSDRFKITERKKTEILNLFFRRTDNIPAENQIFEDFENDDVSSTICESEQYAVPCKTIIGDKTGIQNWSKTNFLESIIISLFAKSDNLDFLIHPMIKENECGQKAKHFRDIMAWKVVYVLREFGYVSSDRIEELMETYEEVNEIEDLITFFSNMWLKESLLSLISYDNVHNECMSLKLFVELNPCLDYITCQELLDISMTQNKMMFRKIPGCLILEAVKDSKSVSSYKYIIPSRRIEISHLHTKSFKKCYICDRGAAWQCSACLTGNGLSIANGLLCFSHKCHHPEISILKQSETQSHSKVSLKLQSILCKLNERYFSFVNELGKENEWLLFKSDKLETSDFPKVTIDEEISAFLNMDEKEQKNTIMRTSSNKLQKLMLESCLFIYKNDSISCY